MIRFVMQSDTPNNLGQVEKDENGKDKLLCISWNAGRPLTMADKDNLMFAESLHRELGPVFRRDFPNLNGTNFKPRIDLSMIQYFVMSNDNKLSILALVKHIRLTLWEYSRNTFVPEADMHVEWRSETSR
ncbi:MAG: hypothetical protein O2897_03905 [bacterium]|nr:hypothetical protein [bacterium]